MENSNKGNDLINLVKTNYKSFLDKGCSYELLQQFFDGYSIENIIILLDHEEYLVNTEGLFILSELGENYCKKYIDYAIKLYKKKHDSIKIYALQCIFLGTIDDPTKFIFILNGIEFNSDSVKMNCIFLLSKANDTQLNSISLTNLDKMKLNSIHLIGIKNLLNKSINREDILHFLKSENYILRIYGMSLVLKHIDDFRELLDSFPIKKDTFSKKLKKNIEKYLL